MWTFSKLMADNVYNVVLSDRLSKTSVNGSCGAYCSGCSGACYVKKSYRYPSVILSHARATYAFRRDLKTAFICLDNQLTRARKKPDVVRINQSGELESLQEFVLWLELAEKHPETEFYLYSKAYPLFMSYLLERGSLPDNFTLNCSIWHEYGVQEFNALKHIDGVKAFVYLDGYDYDKNHGLKVQARCMAYAGGKLNHNITCDNCKLCYNRRAPRVLGCDDHG